MVRMPTNTYARTNNGNLFFFIAGHICLLKRDIFNWTVSFVLLPVSYSSPHGSSCVKLSMMIDKFLSGYSNVNGKSNFSFGSARYLNDSIICGTISSVIKTYCET